MTAPDSKNKNLLQIFFGSQKGNAEGIARSIFQTLLQKKNSYPDDFPFANINLAPLNDFEKVCFFPVVPHPTSDL